MFVHDPNLSKAVLEQFILCRDLKMNRQIKGNTIFKVVLLPVRLKVSQRRLSVCKFSLTW